jgi:tRNA pseudouridine synthase 10
MMNSVESNASKACDIVEKAVAILRDYPLCDRCLGRMFALLGRGWSNKERGDAIKRLVVMGLHARIREGDKEAARLFEQLAPNIGPQASKLYEELFGKQLEPRKCYICGSDLDEWIHRASEESLKQLRLIEARNFLVAAKIDEETRVREDSLKQRYGLSYAESIGSEVKREVSKIIQAKTELKPNFVNPDVVIAVHIPGGDIELQIMPLLLKGRYWKTSRRISQSFWVTRRGEKRYPLSVEEALSPLLDLYDADELVLHASGREDADARMLGTGRPFIVELKRPRKRLVGLREAAASVEKNTNGLVSVELSGEAVRRDVVELKSSDQKKAKVYKALIVTEKEISDKELRGLEEFFRMREIRQRTPRRVRHRRPDLVRERIVYSINARKLAPNVFEAIIVAEGGLYIKELVSGDEGDTSPSFSEYLGAKALCVELDVIGVKI